MSSAEHSRVAATTHVAAPAGGQRPVSRATTSASVVSPNSRYHSPTAMKSGGCRGHTTSSASAASSATVSGGPTGTATTTRAGASGADRGDGGAHRRPGRQPVVDEHDGDVTQHRVGSIAAQPVVPLGELAARHVDACGDVGRGEPEPGDEVVVAHDEAAGRDGADRQLDVAGCADLAHGQHVERRAEPVGDRGGDRHATAWQTEHDRRTVGDAGGDLVGEDPTGVGP